MLKPNESQTLTFLLDAESLASFYSDKSAWITEAGKYTIQVGASIKDIRLSKSFKVAKSIEVKKVNKALRPKVKINELSQGARQ